MEDSRFTLSQAASAIGTKHRKTDSRLKRPDCSKEEAVAAQEAERGEVSQASQSAVRATSSHL
jgi:hypothetical protein